jgi:cell division protein FtsN
MPAQGYLGDKTDSVCHDLRMAKRKKLIPSHKPIDPIQVVSEVVKATIGARFASKPTKKTKGRRRRTKKRVKL